MKFASVLVGLVSYEYQITVEGVEEFVGGLMYGLLQKDDLPEIKKCLQNEQTLETEIETAIADIEKKDFKDILAGIQEIGQIVQELPGDLSDCKNIQGDVDKIEAWAKIFTEPSKLLPVLSKNVLANWKTITADVSKTDTDWKAADYKNAGEDVADILVESVGPISAVYNTLA